MGTTLTPINSFTLPDDNEALKNVYAHVRNHANQLEAALRSRGLTSSDVTGYLDLVGQVNALQAVSDNLTGAWSSYTPTWAAASSAPSVGNGALVGKYKKLGRLCFVDLSITFGSTTNGGRGAWSFTLPAAAVAGREAKFNIKAWTTGGNITGVAYAAGGSNVVNPLAMLSGTNGFMGAVQNADSGGAAGTGVPTVAGNFTFGTNQNLSIYGAYETAS